MPSLASLGTIGILTNQTGAMQRVEAQMRKLRSETRSDQVTSMLLMELSRKLGADTDDVSRVGIMLNPSSSLEWTNLSQGEDAIAQLALQLAQRDPTMGSEELSMAYEKSGSLGDVQSGILICPWRVQGWQKLNLFQQLGN